MSDNTSSQNSTEIVPMSAVQVHDGKVCTTSLDVAKYFEKMHKHVIRDIRETLQTLGKIDRTKFEPIYFEESSYQDEYGREQPMYLMTFNGFMLLTMSYTTEKAMKIKIEYMNCFDRLAAERQENKKAENGAADFAFDFPPEAAQLSQSMNMRLWENALRAAKLDNAGTRAAMSWFASTCRLMLASKKARKTQPAAQPATAQLARSSDSVTQFVHDWCEVESLEGKTEPKDFQFSEKASELYAAFCVWFLRNVSTRKAAPAINVFGMALTQLGFLAVKHSGCKMRCGLRLNNAASAALAASPAIFLQ